MIDIQKFVFNPFKENTYVIWDPEKKESVIVDPVCYSSKEKNEISNFISEENLSVKYLINTHCHIDHVLGNSFIKEKYHCEFLAPEKDLPLLHNLVNQAEMFGVNAKRSPEPDNFLYENLQLNLGNNIIDFLFTPGHTPGEYCLLFDSENVCISGDVLFLDSIGRTDLWGGDYLTLLESISSKLFVLPVETTIYPGHGDMTTIGHEIENNPFLK